MGTSKIVVQGVVSPGTVRAHDGKTYVLRGIPDVEDDFVHFAAARALVEQALLGKELHFADETASELPDLPGTEIEAFDADGAPITPGLAAKVAGVLANRPLR
jgi:hypothetical protein